ncbi:hypothetical protein NKH73_31555 [Mesorhizobium sp. M0938]
MSLQAAVHAARIAQTANDQKDQLRQIAIALEHIANGLRNIEGDVRAIKR